jgi:hypothetical protein
MKSADAQEPTLYVTCEHCQGHIVPDGGYWHCLSCGCEWDTEWQQVESGANCPERIAGVIAQSLGAAGPTKDFLIIHYLDRVTIDYDLALPLRFAALGMPEADITREDILCVVAYLHNHPHPEPFETFADALRAAKRKEQP